MKLKKEFTLLEIRTRTHSKFTDFCYYWLPPLALTLGIIAFAGDLGSVQNFRLSIYLLKLLLPHYPAAEIYRLSMILRKVGHFLAYGILCWSYLRAFYHHWHRSMWSSLGLALLICLLVAMADEGRQAFYTSRNGSPVDILLDLSGAVTAGFFWLGLQFLRRCFHLRLHNHGP